jgi:tetratricopeptide (TPR) repeat protein
MSMRIRNLTIILGLIVGLALVFSHALDSQERRPSAPEYRLLIKARRIKDPNVRLSELERIKSEYPESKHSRLIESAIISAKVELSTSLEEIIELQSQQFQKASGINRLLLFYYSGLSILRHEKISQFDRRNVTQAIILYAEEAEKFAKNPQFLQNLSDSQKPMINRGLAMCYLMVSQAYLNEAKPQEAKDALTQYLERGGQKDKAFWYTQGIVFKQLGEIQKAFDSFFIAASENFGDSVNQAKELYQKLHGSLEGFEDRLEAKRRELPFEPTMFKPTKEWRGKAVLAELFTGSECPPCVAADMGFDGLIEAYSQDQLVILEYHLPIPRPDPIMNAATRARAIYYGVNSTPTVYIDGEKKLTGGGPRLRAKGKFDEYSAEINSRVYRAPAVKVGVRAKRNGDDVSVTVTFDQEVSGADYNLVLVQEEVKYTGGNGILFHKKVVRDFKTVTPEEIKDEGFVFNILDAEKAGAQRLAEYEKEINFTFKEKHFKIDRSRLQVVFFVQERSTHKVYNAAVCDVK